MHSSTKPSTGNNHLPRGYIPTQNSDILCGRGKANAKHPANKRFLRLIESSIEEYKAATSRVQKSAIVTSVASKVYDSGMRFIDMDMTCGQYVELSSDRAHAKVGHAIRDVCKQQKKAQGSPNRTLLKQKQAKQQQHVPDFASKSFYAVDQVYSTNHIKSHASDKGEDQPDNITSAVSQQNQDEGCRPDKHVSRNNSWLYDSARKIFARRVFSFSSHVPLEQFAEDGELSAILSDLGQQEQDDSTDKNNKGDQGNGRESGSIEGAHSRMSVDDVLRQVFGDSPLPAESSSDRFGFKEVENLSDLLDDLNPTW